MMRMLHQWYAAFCTKRIGGIALKGVGRLRYVRGSLLGDRSEAETSSELEFFRNVCWL